MRRWGAVFVFTFLGLTGNTQQAQLHVDLYDFRQGLSNQVGRVIFQDHLGFIWVGTDFGLNRFDGIGFTSWYNDPGDPNSLVHNKVLGITEDRHHKLWIGTQEGLSCFDPSSQQFINYSKEGKGLFHFVKKACIVFTDSADNIWIGHDQGISVLDAKRSAFKEFPVALQPTPNPTNKYVCSFNEDKGSIWAATSFGIYKFDKTSLEYVHLIFPSSKGNALTSSAFDNKGRLWCGSWYSGLVWWDPTGNSLQHMKLPVPGIIDSASPIMSLVHVMEEKTSWLYISVLNGLIKVKTEELVEGNMSSLIYHSTLNNRFFLTNGPEIMSFFSDRTGNTWFGTMYNGVARINLHGSRFWSIPYSHIAKNDFPPYRIIPDEAGSCWIFTRRDVLRFDIEKKDFVVYPLHPRVGRFDMARTGNTYWISTDSGLLELDKQMKLVNIYGISPSDGLTTSRLRRIFPDSKGRLWIGAFRQGIALFDIAKKRFIQKFHTDSEPVNFKGAGISVIIEDREHTIWLGSGLGLFRYDTEQDQVQKIPLCNVAGVINDCENIQCLLESSDNKLYIGTSLGFYLYDLKERKVTSILLRGQGISRNIQDIAEDDDHKLWLVTNNGLLFYDPVTEQVRQFSLKNGLPDNELSELYKLNDKFLTGVPGAIVMFDPKELQVENFAPSPVFSSIYVNDTNAVSYSDAAPSIRYNHSISFNFISLNYLNAAQNQYSYKLVGLDNDWKSLGNEHSLRFSNLPAGSYTLLVKAANSDGKWNETPASFRFSVIPPFWKTWWFISLCVVVITGGVFALYRYRLNAALKMERLRTRIATDLHDDIGATLSSISMYSEAVKKQVKGTLPHLEPVLKKMEESSRNMVSTMSDIVWTINPENDAGEKLLDRIEAYAKDTAGINDVQLHYSANEKINGFLLSPEHRKNIYLIFKEAFTNALKYSKAKQVWVSLETTHGLLKMTIRDDGKGFATGQAFPGNGLKNMRNRAAEIGGTIAIDSQPGKGTTIILQIKIT